MTTMEYQPQPSSVEAVWFRAVNGAKFLLERLTGTGESFPSGRDTSQLGVSAYFDRTVQVVPVPVEDTTRRLPLRD